MSCGRLVHVVKLLTHLQLSCCDLQENARPDPLRSYGAPWTPSRYQGEGGSEGDDRVGNKEVGRGGKGNT